MAQKFTVLTEDTGCKTKELRAYMENLGAYLNVEVPNPLGVPTAPERLADGSIMNFESPQNIVTVNLSINYGPGTRTSRKTAMGRLKKARDKLEMATEVKGIYGGEFNEEEPGIGDDFGFVEQVYTLPFPVGRDGQDGVEAILNQIGRAVDNLTPQYKMGCQLEQLFSGKLDGRTLEGVVRGVDAELERVTTETNSIGVVKFKSQGQIGYGKVSTNTDSLRNEHNALNAIQSDKIARVLAPVPIGLALTEEAGALFTWGTQNKGVYKQEDVDQYFSLFNTLIFQYAQEKKLDLAKLAKDPLVRDVFNRALINTSLKDYVSLNERPNVLTLEELQTSVKEKSPESVELAKFNKLYADASRRVVNLNPGNPVFLHGDARPENIGKDAYGLRPLVDWANAKMGSFAIDFSALETDNAQQYLDWYKFVSGFRGKDFVTQDAKELVACYQVLQPFRTSTFMLRKNRIADAQRDIRRLGKNAKLYNEMFG